MSYTFSAVLVTPADQLEDANKVGLALGYSANEFTVPASDNGTDITHYYCHSWCNEVFGQMVNSLGEGTVLEADYEAAGLTQEQYFTALSRLIVSCRDGADPAQHVDEVLAANGLGKL
jgi:uncharacterized protein with beta-barrel porin domain